VNFYSFHTVGVVLTVNLLLSTAAGAQTGPDRSRSMSRLDIADDAAPTVEHVQPPFNARSSSAEVARDHKRNQLKRQEM
jgi:hypothetical protein